MSGLSILMTTGYNIVEDINMSYTIKSILVEAAEDYCSVDVEMLHDSLLHLPAEKYLELYRLMNEKIDSIK